MQGGESSTSNPVGLLDNLGGLLGTPRGLSGTHNTFEVDGSPTRNDLYDPIGNNNGKSVEPTLLFCPRTLPVQSSVKILVSTY